MTEKRFKHIIYDDCSFIVDEYNQFRKIDFETDCIDDIISILNELEKEKEYWRDKALHKELIE